MPDKDNDPKTPGNQSITDEVLSRMAQQIAEIHAAVTELRPYLEAYRRGGLIGARTAARRMGKTGG